MESIIRRLLESQRVDEAWPASLNTLTRLGKEMVRRALLKNGFDIEKSDVQEIQLSSGRDPRLKGGDAIVIKAGKAVDVYVGGKFVLDNFAGMSWRDIIATADRMTLLKIDTEQSKEMRQKQAARKEAQKGMVQRHKVGDTKNSYGGKYKASELDKSGYLLDPNKYRDMFIEMNIKNGVEILKRAKDMFVKAAEAIDTIDFETDRDYHNYENLMRQLPSNFRELKKSLAEYEESKKVVGDEDEKAEFVVKWRRGEVVHRLQDILDTMKYLKKYLG